MKKFLLRKVAIRSLVIVVAIFSLAGGVLLDTQNVFATNKPKVTKVKGTATLQFFSGEACAPHTGSCLKGELTGDLAGQAFIRIFDRQVVEGSARTVSLALADIAITRHDGRLDGGATGFSDTVTGEFANVVPCIGGTGRYENATGVVRFEGTTDFATGVAHETYRGVLVLN